jgi:hypothetical protein
MGANPGRAGALGRAAPGRRAASRSRLVDANHPAVQARSVQGADGLLGRFRRRHLDKSEAARSPGLAIGHYRR